MHCATCIRNDGFIALTDYAKHALEDKNESG